MNPHTKFIWAFILPVLLIILVNIGFFIMAAIVMWKHRKRQTGEMKRKDVASWLKALWSLVVVMGFTWIIGVLIVEVKELLPLAYLYTISVAFQGVWIFLLYIVFAKKVREDITKAWRKQIKESDKFAVFFTKSTAASNVSFLLHTVLLIMCLSLAKSQIPLEGIETNNQ